MHLTFIRYFRKWCCGKNKSKERGRKQVEGVEEGAILNREVRVGPNDFKREFRQSCKRDNTASMRKSCLRKAAIQRAGECWESKQKSQCTWST